MTPNNVIKYYKDCYQADNRELQLLNFFSKKVENTLFFQEKEELLTGEFSAVHVNDAYADKMHSILHLHGREKKLYYCAFFITGLGTNMQGKEQKICAPLLLYPAQITFQDGLNMVSVNFQNRLINFSILYKIRDKHLDDKEFYLKVREQLPQGHVDLRGAGDVERCLQHWCSQIETSEVLFYPTLTSERTLKQITNITRLKEQKGYRLVPSCALGLIKKSQQTIGVLHELEVLGKQQSFSQPLQHLLGMGRQRYQEAAQSFEYTPALLSEAQKQILHSAQQNPLTLAIGPPGTGKSFTIANLAIDFFTRGKSVLIVSRSDQAVDVIAHKIENQLGISGVVVRGGRKDYLKKLKNHLENIISGIGIKGHSQTTIDRYAINLRNIQNQLIELKSSFNSIIKRENKAAKMTAYATERGGPIGKQLIKLYLKLMVSDSPLIQQIKKMEELIASRQENLSQLVTLYYDQMVAKVLKSNRKILNSFLNALRAKTGNIQQRHFDNMNFQTLLNVFPIWLVNTSDISTVLPFGEELFDLVIIDEASQCDIASCLPVIQRAKHVVAAGDPKQLRHVSFLSYAKMKSLREEYDLEDLPEYDFRSQSVLDLINSTIEQQSQVIALDEHFRSKPSIIQFSNIEFYGNKLKIMTQKPDSHLKKSLYWCPCDGKREKQGYNEKEANEIIRKILEISKKEKESDQPTSIGILSPFRGQADYILDNLQKLVPGDVLSRHQVSVGTAHAFQGDEKDVILLSFVVDDDSHPTAIRHINQDEVFNVSITRAKNQQYVYTSIKTNSLPINSLLRKYLEQINVAPSLLPSQLEMEHDVFLQDVLESLDDWQEDFKVFTAYYIAGTLIDIAIEHDNKIYGIDLIGYPGNFSGALELDRYLMLMRIGIKVLPLPYTLWFLKKLHCQNLIREMVGFEELQEHYYV